MNKKYFLTNSEGSRYESFAPGRFGGHRKLKIYGKLDCSSALRSLIQGHYHKYRVFFENETVAILAGYRPCGVCMKKQYIKWKLGPCEKNDFLWKVTPSIKRKLGV